MQAVKQQEELERRERELEEEQKRKVEEEKMALVEAERKKLEMERRKKERLERQEKQLRDKILKNINAAEHRKAEQLREDLRRRIEGKTKLKSAVILRK